MSMARYRSIAVARVVRAGSARTVYPRGLSGQKKRLLIPREVAHGAPPA
jgi:hypothetical protein